LLAPPIPWRSWRFILSRRLPRRKHCAPKAANAVTEIELKSVERLLPIHQARVVVHP
jgi:hypothetical protein